MINTHLFQSTNEYTGKAATQELGNVLINHHQDNCVKVCLTNIWATKGKATWKPDNVSSVSTISLLFIRNMAEKMGKYQFT